jgi:hypothetical protein
VAAQVLAAFGADLQRVRAEVVRLLAEYPAKLPDAGGSGDAS